MALKMEVMWNLQDILILSVCMFLMSVYLSFLTYEWIKNKRKKVVEVNLKLSFVVPAAYKIYCILGKKVKFNNKIIKTFFHIWVFNIFNR